MVEFEAYLLATDLVVVVVLFGVLSIKLRSRLRAALIVGALFGEETFRFAALLWQMVRAG